MRPVIGWRVCMYYHKLNAWTKKTIFLCPSWIRCWIDLPKKGGTAFLMDIWGIIRFLLHKKIKKKHLYLSMWDLCVQQNVVWVVQCTRILSEMYDVNIFWHGGGYYRSFYGWFFCGWWSFERCLTNLSEVIKRCEDCNWVLNWENVISWWKRVFFWVIPFQKRA